MTDKGGQLIPADGLDTFAGAYPDTAARLTHELRDHPLFALDALAALAERLPDDHIEHNLGNVAVDQDQRPAAQAGLTPPQIVRSIAENGCWMVMKKVDADPLYAELIDACLGEIAPIVVPRTGAYQRCEAFVFLSSPDAVTPFHMDPEHNILLQIAGEKTITVYPRGERRLVPQRHHEAFHRGRVHRNMAFDPSYDAFAKPVRLLPGDAVYVPVKAPHWVRNGPLPSISFSITWRSEASDREARLHRVNHRLRQFGIEPAAPGTHPALDRFKVAGHRAGKRLTDIVRRLAGRDARDRAAY